jgi:uncharacterized low-complexity protein
MKTTKSIVATVGTAVLLGTGSMAMAAENPFAAQSLTSGYQLAEMDKAAEAKCGEGKCGADGKKEMRDGKKAMEEGKCGEGKCGADGKKDMHEGKAMEEGKCGEGKCGADSKKKMEG